MMNYFYFFLAMVLAIAIGCEKEIITEPANQKPIIDFSHTIDDDELSLSGSIRDADGTISEVIIEWGDSSISKPANIDFSQFEIIHSYTVPKPYTISITAIDNDNDSSFYSLTVSLNFIATPLQGIKESIFKNADDDYLILTINMHTYQESQQDEKFDILVDVIGLLDVDFIAMQECAQHKSSQSTTGNLRDDNMALVVSNRLKSKYDVEYNLVWDWAHYGWNVWEEGVAVLSKHPLIETDTKYISTNTSVNNITSRKVIYGAYQIPEGKVNVFSAHTHWRTSEADMEQNNQIQNIKDMAFEKEVTIDALSTFICGDFNGNPTSSYPWSEGYNTMMNDAEYEDTFLEIYPDANNIPSQNIYNTVGGSFPGRIDYIFSRNNEQFEIMDAQVIFTNEVAGKISDHNGVLTKVNYAN